ncbi:unnamed protein product, partial [marine sediment metagenome]
MADKKVFSKRPAITRKPNFEIADPSLEATN